MANVNLMHSPIAAGFDIARKEFLSNFSEKDQEAFVKFTSIDDVYDATDELQKKQAQTQTLQNLRKIQPYIECLNQYSGVVETIVQIKPDFLAIIWVFTIPPCLFGFSELVGSALELFWSGLTLAGSSEDASCRE